MYLEILISLWLCWSVHPGVNLWKKWGTKQWNSLLIWAETSPLGVQWTVAGSRNSHTRRAGPILAQHIQPLMPKTTPRHTYFSRKSLFHSPHQTSPFYRLLHIYIYIYMGQIHLASSFFISWPLPFKSWWVTSFKMLIYKPLPLLGYVVEACQLCQVSDLLLPLGLGVLPPALQPQRLKCVSSQGFGGEGKDQMKEKPR